MATHTLPKSTIAGWPRGLTYLGAAILALLVLGLAVLGLYAVHELQGMAGNLQQVSVRLGTLESMNHKLDRLETVSASLARMQTQLRATNGSLGETNQLLRITNAKLDVTNRATLEMSEALKRTESDIRALGTIRGDIHQMAHKIAGSFLFKGVK